MKIVNVTNGQNKKLVSVISTEINFLFLLLTMSVIFIQEITAKTKLTQY